MSHHAKGRRLDRLAASVGIRQYGIEGNWKLIPHFSIALFISVSCQAIDHGVLLEYKE